MAGKNEVIQTYKLGEALQQENVNADQYQQEQDMKNVQQKEEPQQQPGKDGDKTPDKFKGKTPEQIAEMYTNLEKKMGDQSKELGELRKMVKDMGSAQQNQVDQGNQSQAQADDFMTQMQAIQEQVENGEIDVAEGLAKTNELTLQQANRQFDQRLQEYDQSRTAQELQQEFSSKHPDFTELRDNGALDEVIQANPMHDEFSAYFEYKWNETQKAIDAAKEEGRQEAQKLAEGAEQQRTILSKPGATVRQAQQRQTGPLSEPQIVQGQLEAMKRARGDA